MSSKSIKKYKIELRCEICNNAFDSISKIPKILSCGHTLCSKCLSKMSNKNILRCPFDRKPFDTDTSLISINYYILSLVDQDNSSFPIKEDLTSTELTVTPSPVINTPGWKQTLDAFIKGNILYSVEANGYVYCTDITTGEWWFMYHYQFYGKFIFRNKKGDIFLIDQFGSLYQLCEKNFYMQIGKKNAWKNTLYATVFEEKLYTIESPDKFYETDLSNGKWKEIVIKKEKNEKMTEIEERLFHNIIMLISNEDSVIFSNKYGEVFQFKEDTGETRLVSTEFDKDIESYYKNEKHVYYLRRSNQRVIYRAILDENDESFMIGKEYIDLSQRKNLYPIKIIVNEDDLVIIDQKGEINLFHIKDKINSIIPDKNYQCLFILRNCHLISSCIINEIDFLLLDPIRLSVNILNLIEGTEIVLIHSNKFLFNIRTIFSANNKIYFIDITGNLFSFNESDKKLSQIGINGICKYMNDYVVYKNYLFTVENTSIYRTDLKDGNFIEMYSEYCMSYEYFLCDNVYIVFITRKDEIAIFTYDKNNPLSFLIKHSSFYIKDISKNDAVTLFRGHIIYYDSLSKSIKAVHIDKPNEIRTLVDNFPSVKMFITNQIFLGCILSNGVIYKLII